MAATTQPQADPQKADLREPPSWRRTKNQIMTVLMVLAFVFAIVPLGFVLVTVIAKGASVISWSFLTSSIPPNVLPANVGGMGPAIVGTLEITALATVIAVPLGILGAIYINEYGGKGILARVIRFMSDVMTGVPSIIMGLFIFTIWTLHFGYSGLGGALALACLMLPIVIRSSEEMLKLVPDALREGAYALGATKARVTMTVTLPAAVGGIVSGALLAVARAAGETAPLLFTIGTVTSVNRNVFSGATTSLPSQIFLNAAQPYTGAQARGWGAALTLVVIAFIFMIVARLVTARFARYSALGIVMEQSEQDVVAKAAQKALTDLPPEPLVRQPAEPAGTGNVIFDVRERLHLLRRVQGRDGRHPAHLRARDHRVHRLVRQRQVDGAARVQPDERPGARRAHGRRDALPRRPAVRQRRLADRRAPAHRHGLPEAEPVPEVDLRQRRLRAAHQRRAQQGQA